MQRCLEYAPDLVLLNFNTNDYDVPNFMRRPRDLATLRRSYLFDLAYSVYDGVMGARTGPTRAFDFRNRTTALRQAAHLDEDPALPDEYRYMVGAKGVVRALERLAAAARERAIPFVVFDVKAYPGLDPKYVRDEWRDGQRELLERESRRLGFHFLNTYPYFMDYLKQHPDANLRTGLRGVGRSMVTQTRSRTQSTPRRSSITSSLISYSLRTNRPTVITERPCGIIAHADDSRRELSSTRQEGRRAPGSGSAEIFLDHWRRVLRYTTGNMSDVTRSLGVLFAGALLFAPAQWLNYPTPGTPRGADGKPNLSAKAPRAANGKPDLSGVWRTAYDSPDENERLFGPA